MQEANWSGVVCTPIQREESRALQQAPNGPSTKKSQHLNVNATVPHYQPSHLSGGTNCTAASSVSADHQPVENYVGRKRQSGRGIDELESAQSGVSQMLNTPSTGSAMDGDSDIDWLHNNPTYQRQTIDSRCIWRVNLKGCMAKKAIYPT